MKSLLVTRQVTTWGPQFGAKLRLQMIASALARQGPIDLLLLTTRTDETLPEHSTFQNIEVLSLPRPLLAPNANSTSYVSSPPIVTQERAYVSSALTEAPIAQNHYDVVWCNRERSWLLVRGLFNAPMIVDVDDLEDVILERWLALGKTDTGSPCIGDDEGLMRSDIRWWQEVHAICAEEANVVAFASTHDSSCFGPTTKSFVIPNCYEPPSDAFPARRLTPANHATILFQGLMTWPPNEDAALWLVEEIAPLIWEHLPTCRIVLVGQPTERIRRTSADPRVNVVGQVPSLRSWLEEADLVLVPLRVGSGSRIKILEAFANRVPVVSTSIGAEGLDLVAGTHIMIADTAVEIANQSVRVLQEQTLRDQIVSSAWLLLCGHYRVTHAQAAVASAIVAARAAPPSMGDPS